MAEFSESQSKLSCVYCSSGQVIENEWFNKTVMTLGSHSKHQSLPFIEKLLVSFGGWGSLREVYQNNTEFETS